MIETTPGPASSAGATHAPLLEAWLLRPADTSLVLAQQLAAWVGHAPALEEDLGLANIALDLLGQARWLLGYCAELEGAGRTEDDLAFGREPHEFRNLALAEQPNGDFACTIVRQMLLDAHQLGLYGALQSSRDARLAQLAVRALKETHYHFRYSSHWLVRLGDGTAESRSRAQAALESLWRFTGELFAPDELDAALCAQGIAPRLADLKAPWLQRIGAVLREATLSQPPDVPYRWQGKRGEHGEHLGLLLAEMQSLHRAHPGARW
ncbi:MAG TPA: 1,2-phenylacetyl-CoA epoxidase subunit PaaC [Steroidobacteraceae bacterium]|nr:1,2-phenylacetyl-CoA epoxidase subunit PaaC [Steroidobacteraceae bacterium]